MKVESTPSKEPYAEWLSKITRARDDRLPEEFKTEHPSQPLENIIAANRDTATWIAVFPTEVDVEDRVLSGRLAWSGTSLEEWDRDTLSVGLNIPRLFATRELSNAEEAEELGKRVRDTILALEMENSLQGR